MNPVVSGVPDVGKGMVDVMSNDDWKDMDAAALLVVVVHHRWHRLLRWRWKDHHYHFQAL